MMLIIILRSMEIVRNEDLGCELQIIKADEEVWFRGKTVCEILEYTDTNQAIRMHVREKHKKRLGDVNPVNLTGLKGNAKNQIFINEPGLYSLILKSKMPQAEAFQDWICEDVLPSIRKTGKYEIGKIETLKLDVSEEIDDLTEINYQISGMNIGNDRKTLLYEYIGESCLSGNISEAKAKIKLIPETVKKIHNLRQDDKIKTRLFTKLYDEFKVKKIEPIKQLEYVGQRNYDVPEDESFF